MLRWAVMKTRVGLTRDDKLGRWIITEETKVLGSRYIRTEAARLRGELVFMLGVERKGKYVPCIKCLVVRCGNVERDNLVLLLRPVSS